MHSRGNVDSFAKWENSSWKVPDDTNRGRSFAICRQEFIINDPNNNSLNIMIFADGSRIEDHSKDNFEIKHNKSHADKIINHYENQNVNIKILSFYMDADAPIKEQAKLLARYIESNFNDNVDSVTIIGLSKCALLNMYIPKYIENKNKLNKLNVINIAGPYKGALLASPKYLEEKLLSIFGNNIIGKNIVKKLMNLTQSISSNSHMDYDIALPGGIPDEKINLYDSSFIDELFSDENISALKKCNSFTNYATSISNKSIKNSIKHADYTGIGLLILSKILYDKKSDGFIPTDEQIIFDETRFIDSSHSILTNDEVIELILNETDMNLYYKNKHER